MKSFDPGMSRPGLRRRTFIVSAVILLGTAPAGAADTPADTAAALFGKWMLGRPSPPECSAIDHIEFTDKTVIVGAAFGAGNAAHIVTYGRDGDRYLATAPDGSTIIVVPDSTGIRMLSPLNCEFVRDGQPIKVPTRDAVVQYREGGQTVTVHFAVDLKMTRVDFPGGRLIIDHGKNMALSIYDSQKAYRISPLSPADPDPWHEAWTTSPDYTFTYVNSTSANAAKVACNLWHVTAAHDPDIGVCLTADGVLINLHTAGSPELSAVTVSYGPQAASLFVIPPGYSQIVPKR